MTRLCTIDASLLVLVLVLVLVASARSQHLYYGFFPDSPQTETGLKVLARTSLTQLMTYPTVRAAYANCTGHRPNASVQELTDFVYANPTRHLHVTAKFCNYSCSDYAKQQSVQASLGRQFSVKVTHLLVTPRTFGFRVSLTAQQLRVWAQPNETVRGERAHFTVSTAPGVAAVQTGFDILAVLRRLATPANVSVDRVDSVLDFGESQFQLRLSPPLQVVARFKGSDSNSAPKASRTNWRLLTACLCSFLLIGC